MLGFVVNPKVRIPLIILFSIILVIGLLFLSRKSRGNITSFDECSAAGYPIQESYPAVCITPDGLRFVQNIDAVADDPNAVACTLDAKICPDGSAVGRVAPNCEFSPCP